jgi:hypothetical protein
LQIQKTQEDPVHFSCDVDAAFNKRFESENIMGTHYKEPSTRIPLWYSLLIMIILVALEIKPIMLVQMIMQQELDLCLASAKWYIANPPPFSIVLSHLQGKSRFIRIKIFYRASIN